MMNQSGVYRIRNVTNDKVYVGSALRFSDRWKGHRSCLSKRCHHSKHLQSAWNKYGADSFVFEPLLVCKKEDLLFYEQRVMDAYSKDGEIYNTCKVAGNTLGFKHSPETRAEISEASKRMVRTAEHCEKIRQSQIGKVITLAQREKISATLIGRPLPEETKLKLSLAMTGKTMPREGVERSALKRTGQKRSAEAKAKMSIAVRNAYKVMPPEMKARMNPKGRKRSPESIEKTAAANRGRKMAPGVGLKRWATRRLNQQTQSEAKNGF